MKTKYETSWDRYSKEWEKRGIEGKDLGVEWGDDSLTRDVHERFLAPRLTPDATVLEIGPGGGKYSAGAAPACRKLICADVSSEMLRRTKKRPGDDAPLETVKLNGLDFTGIDDASIDFAFSIDVFVHLDLEDIYVYLREFKRVLRPGGKLVLHFASLLTFPGFDLFFREADINRAQYKQIGRINFMTPELARRLFEGVGFEIEEVDTETSPRDFLIAARKPELPADPLAEERARRILERTGAAAVARDFVGEFPLAIRVAPDERYTGVTPLTIDGETRQSLFAHPPAQIAWPLTIPPKATLHATCGLSPDVWEKCYADGVLFRVAFRCGTEEHEIFSRTVDPVHRPEDRAWHEIRADLSKHGGKVGMLVFETRIGAGPNDYNWCGFGEPAIVTD